MNRTMHATLYQVLPSLKNMTSQSSQTDKYKQNICVIEHFCLWTHLTVHQQNKHNMFVIIYYWYFYQMWYVWYELTMYTGAWRQLLRQPRCLMAKPSSIQHKGRTIWLILCTDRHMIIINNIYMMLYWTVDKQYILHFQSHYREHKRTVKQLRNTKCPEAKLLL